MELPDKASDTQTQRLLERAWRKVDEMVAHDRLPPAKWTKGINEGWLRTSLGGVGGSQWYLWWAYGERVGSEPDTIVVFGVRDHDETDRPIPAASLSPERLREARETLRTSRVYLTESQRNAVDKARRALDTRETKPRAVFLKGHAGTGKTVTLIEALVRAAEAGHRSLYVTLHHGLASWCDKEARAHGLEDGDCRFVSLPDLYREWMGALGDRVGRHEVASDCRAQFVRWWQERDRSHRNRVDADLLYDHLYAHPVARNGCDRRLPRELRQCVARARKALGEATNRERFVSFFPSPAMASSLLDRLDELIEKWWEDDGNRREALIIDELQDLSRVELELFGRLRDRLGLQLIVAGDESQRVWPSDFDWGTAARLLAPDGDKEEVSFSDSLRFSGEIRALVDAVSSRKSLLDKGKRPSTVAVRDRDPASDGGRVHWVDCTEEEARSEVLDRIAEATTDFRAVDLMPAQGGSGGDAGRPVDCLRAKGLEWPTVAVLGLGEAWRRFDELRARSTANGTGEIAALRARALLDRMVVSVSRASQHLAILMEGPKDLRVLEDLEEALRERGVDEHRLRTISAAEFVDQVDEKLSDEERMARFRNRFLERLRSPQGREDAAMAARDERRRHREAPHHYAEISRLLGIAHLLWALASESEGADAQVDAAIEAFDEAGATDYRSLAETYEQWREEQRGPSAPLRSTRILVRALEDPRLREGEEDRLLRRELGDALHRGVERWIDKAGKGERILGFFPSGSHISRDEVRAELGRLLEALATSSAEHLRPLPRLWLRAMVENYRKTPQPHHRVLVEILRAADPRSTRRGRPLELGIERTEVHGLLGQLLERVEEYAQAARHYGLARRPREQVTCLRRAMRHEAAVRLCRRIGDHDQAELVEWYRLLHEQAAKRPPGALHPEERRAIQQSLDRPT